MDFSWRSARRPKPAPIETAPPHPDEHGPDPDPPAPEPPAPEVHAQGRFPLVEPHELATLDRLTVEGRIRGLAQSVFLGDHRMLARVLGRYKLFLDTRDRGFACHLALDGYWEIWLTQFLARTLQLGMTAFDIGANFGYYSILMGELVGSAGHVVSVEPNPEAAAFLADSVVLNGMASRTRIVGTALGEQAGTANFFVPHGEPKNALVIAAPGQVDPARGVLREVQVGTVDDLAASLPRVDLIKIDAEGAERGIFCGMQATLARCRPLVVMEFNTARCSDPAAFVDELEAYSPVLSELDFNGDVAPVSREALLADSSGEDRLLVLRAPPAGDAP